MRIGSYVEDKVFPHKGRVYKLHDRCPEGAFWLSQQSDDVQELVDQPWASVLVHGGGAVVRPVVRLKEVAPFDFRNDYAEKHFGSEPETAPVPEPGSEDERMEILNDLVHDAASEIASYVINNGEQVEWLISQGWTEEQIKERVDDQVRTLNRIEIVDGPVRVSFDYIGEGTSGDYDESDPDDVALLRLDCNIHAVMGYGGEATGDDDWLYPQDGSICTQVPYDTPLERQRELLRMVAADLRRVVEADESVKGAMDRYSWLDSKSTKVRERP